MNLRGFKGFFKGEWRKNGRHALGQHGFAGTGRTDHEDVVATGAGNFKGALGGLLAADVFKIHQELLRLVQQGFAIDLYRCDTIALN